MIRKTVKDYKRLVQTWNFDYEKHIERVLCETWWLFWIIPIYSRETIITTNI